MTKTISVLGSLIALLALGSLWWAFRGRPHPPMTPVGQSDVATFRGDSYEFEYPKNWYVSPAPYGSATGTVAAYITKYPQKDDFGIMVSRRTGATFNDLKRELTETTALQIQQGSLEGRFSLRTLSYLDDREIFEEAILEISQGVLSIATHHPVDDVEHHDAFLMIARTLRSTK